MITLPKGCACSELAVSPSNWKTSKASVKNKWYISYRFYDYSLKDQTSKKYWKQVIIKGMNEFAKLADRQVVTQNLIDQEIATLKNGYNPIRKTMEIIDTASDLSPDTPFLLALHKGFEECSLAPRTREDISSNLRYFSYSATMLMKHNIPISEIRKKDLLQVLKKL